MSNPWAGMAQAQQNDTRVWSLVEDGVPVEWPLTDAAEDEPIEAVKEDLYRSYEASGFFFASLDSVRFSDDSTRVVVHSSPGNRLTVRSVQVVPDSDWDAVPFQSIMRVREGREFVPGDLNADIEDLLDLQIRRGAMLATAIIDRFSVHRTSMEVDITVALAGTRRLELAAIQVNEDSRMTPSLLARIAELSPGDEIRTYDPDRLRRRLVATSFVSAVGEPEIRIDGNGDVILFVPVTDAPPGSFDIVLGYLPSTGTGGGTVVGTGHLELVNMFGGGRTFGLKLNRLPGQVASVEAEADDPFVAGWPVGVALKFDGYQQDSTYSRQAFASKVSYQLATGLRVLATASREATRPGQAGLRIISGRQRIPRANAYFFGLGMEYRNLDFAPNPRRGFLAEMNLERGRSRRESTVVQDGDTTALSVNLRQQRFNASARLVVPTFVRQAVVAGGDASAVISSDYRENDLFRFGGASTLRGYNEQQFIGRFVGRVLAEYRYQLDRTSYAFVFSDLGFVETPQFDSISASRTFHPGFGFGIQFETAIGFVNATYAMNNKDGLANGRVHIGLSFGL